MRCIIFYLSVFILLLFPRILYAEQSLSGNKKILVISSYSPLKEGGNHIILSFLERINAKTDVSVMVEYMDSESYPDYDYWLKWVYSLFGAYKNAPDMVVLIGEEVWSAYRKCCVDSWKNIPVILGGMKKSYVDYEKLEKDQVLSIGELCPFTRTLGDFKVTGYYLVDYFEENLNLIKCLQPGITEVAFFYDDRYHHTFFEDYLNRLVQKMDGMNLHYWSGSHLSTAELLDSINSLKNNAVLFSAGWYTDLNGYSHSYSMLQNEISRHPDKLVYEISDQNQNVPNCIGGYFVSGKEIGTDLADLAVMVLSQGLEKSPVFGLTPSRPKYHLNHQVFRNMGLNENVLPGDVVWYNEEVSLW